MPRKIEISHRSVIFVFLLLGGFWFVYQTRQITFLLFIATILMSALNPAVDNLQRFRVPRWLAISILYLGVVGVVSTAVASVIPPLVEQTASLISQLPMLTRSMSFANIDASVITSQFSELSKIPANILKLTSTIFSNVISIFTLGILTFYLLMERKDLKKYLTILFGTDGEKRAEAFVDKVENQLGGWVRGETVLMTVVGLLSYIGLVLLGVPFALPLSIIAGLFEVVPTIGPIISAIPAIIAGLTISVPTAIAVAALYFVVQQIENSILVPKIMQRATGVNPLVSLLALMIGFNLAGPFGAMLSIPTLLIIKIIVSEYFESRKH